MVGMLLQSRESGVQTHQLLLERDGLADRRE
jgi:hypothetical protein